jgi:hypothetical protein
MSHPPKKEPARDIPQAEKPKPSTRPLAEKIGFERLDLTVEEVEERISPRETNVFDK